MQIRKLGNNCRERDIRLNRVFCASWKIWAGNLYDAISKELTDTSSCIRKNNAFIHASVEKTSRK